MTLQELESWLEATLDDGLLSRRERQDLVRRLASADLHGQQQEPFFRVPFEVARRRFGAADQERAVSWLQEVCRILAGAFGRTEATVVETHFSGNGQARSRICELLGESSRSVDICVFTITDNHISDAVLKTHNRGVPVRIVADDLKALDPGSDIDFLRKRGVPIRLDSDPSHMHHKFAIFDGKRLLNGSYNWTVTAETSNEENFLVTSDPRLVTAYQQRFEVLWESYGKAGF